MYIDGEDVYKGPGMTWDGYHIPYPEILGRDTQLTGFNIDLGLTMNRFTVARQVLKIVFINGKCFALRKAV